MKLSPLNLIEFRFVRELLWRCFLIGLLIYLALYQSAAQHLRINVAAYILCGVWCYYDGMLWRRVWHLAFVEAAVWYLFAIQIAKLLIAVFGLPGPSP